MRISDEAKMRLEAASRASSPVVVDPADLRDLLAAELHLRIALHEIATTKTVTPQRPEVILDRVVWDAKHALGRA